MLVLVVVSAWTQIPFNFVILLAALKAVPEDYLAAAELDGAGPVRRFLDIQTPIIGPFLIFATVISVLESFTNSFGIVDALSKGGPGGATNILVNKIYTQGFIALDLSGSSTLSVLMMLVVLGISLVQFRLFQRRIESTR
jgi:sn-glycerol 3-phosphate transport system permease protein